MKLTRLLSTFLFAMLTVISGYIMYSNGDRYITAPVWGSILTISAFVTLFMWIIWDFDSIKAGFQKLLRRDTKKKKRQDEDEQISGQTLYAIQELQERVQRLEDEAAVSGLADHSETVIGDDGELMNPTEPSDVEMPVSALMEEDAELTVTEDEITIDPARQNHASQK